MRITDEDTGDNRLKSFLLVDYPIGDGSYRTLDAVIDEVAQKTKEILIVEGLIAWQARLQEARSEV
jgi:hypothetical protein